MIELRGLIGVTKIYESTSKPILKEDLIAVQHLVSTTYRKETLGGCQPYNEHQLKQAN